MTKEAWSTQEHDVSTTYCIMGYGISPLSVSIKRRFAIFEFFPIQQNGLITMNRSFRLEDQSSPFPRDSSFEPSFEGSAATQFRYPSVEVEPRSEGYDEYFDPPLESKYECPICLLGLREPVQTSCGHRFCRGCIVRSIR